MKSSGSTRARCGCITCPSGEPAMGEKRAILSLFYRERSSIRSRKAFGIVESILYARS